MPNAFLKPLLLRQLCTTPQLAMIGPYNNSYSYAYCSLVRRIELDRQQQLRTSILAHQSKGYDIVPSAPGPNANANAHLKGHARG